MLSVMCSEKGKRLDVIGAILMKTWQRLSVYHVHHVCPHKPCEQQKEEKVDDSGRQDSGYTQTKMTTWL